MLLFCISTECINDKKVSVFLRGLQYQVGEEAKEQGYSLCMRLPWNQQIMHKHLNKTL